MDDDHGDDDDDDDDDAERYDSVATVAFWCVDSCLLNERLDLGLSEDINP